MIFPKDPKSYRQFFEAIAQNNTKIMATEDNGRFCVVSQSQAPFGTWDLQEFFKNKAALTKLTAGSPELVFVLIMMDEDDHDVGSTINGSFILLRKCSRQNYEQITDAYNDARNTGKLIVKWLRKFFEKNRKFGIWEDEKSNNEPVGPVQPDNMYGYIFNFSYLLRECIQITEADWGDFLPYTYTPEIEEEI
jgi:hypothetical protein